MNDIKELRKITAILGFFGIAYMAFGIFICLEAARMQFYFGYILAAVPVLLGIMEIVIYFAGDRINGALSMDFALGVLLFILAAMIYRYRVYLYARMTLVIGWLILLSAVIKLQKAVDLRRADANLWLLVLAMVFISLTGAILLILHPTFITRYSPFIYGIFLCVDGAETLGTCPLFAIRYWRIIRKKEAGSFGAPAGAAPQNGTGTELSPLPQSERITGSLPENEEPISTTSFFTDMHF